MKWLKGLHVTANFCFYFVLEICPEFSQNAKMPITPKSLLWTGIITSGRTVNTEFLFNYYLDVSTTLKYCYLKLHQVNCHRKKQKLLSEVNYLLLSRDSHVQ